MDTVHHQGLRLATGAFRTSPVVSLYAEGRESSLENRRLKLALQYALKLKPCRSNPTHDAVFGNNNDALYAARPTFIKPLGVRMGPILQDFDADLTVLASSNISDIPPWQMTKPNVNFELAKTKKGETNPLTYIERFDSVRSLYSDHLALYTDGSKEGKRVSAAVVSHFRVVSCRLPNYSSIFTAEAYGILKALECIAESGRKQSIVFSDSKSCLQSIANMRTNHPLIMKILRRLRILMDENYDVQFCWVPSHVNIRGNELADQAAKRALDSRIIKCHIPHSDFRPLIFELVKNRWQDEWNECLGNKLSNIQPIIDKPIISDFTLRKDQVVFTRCLIGHSWLTHIHLLTGEYQPNCVTCQTPLTIKHILLECVDYIPIRATFFNVDNIQSLFTTVKPEKVISFMREAGLYDLI